MAKFYDRAWVATATAGTGTLTLGAAVTGYYTFAEAGVQNAETVSYVIEDGDDFEYGIGVYTSAGTTLTRGTVTGSKIAGVAGTSKINLSGNARVFITARMADLLSVSETQSANGVYAGPASGAAAVPAFRAIVADDFGTQTANKLFAGPSSGGVAKPSFRDMALADIPDALITRAKIETISRPCLVGFNYGYNESNTNLTNTDASAYTHSFTVAPISTQDHRLDSGTTVAYAAKSASNVIKATYSFTGSGDWDSGGATIWALFRDSETDALRWSIFLDINNSSTVSFSWIITIPDTSSHDYKIRVYSNGSTSSPSSLFKRLLMVEEMFVG